MIMLLSLAVLAYCALRIPRPPRTASGSDTGAAAEAYSVDTGRMADTQQTAINRTRAIFGGNAAGLGVYIYGVIM